jgi:hypothetical protein
MKKIILILIISLIPIIHYSQTPQLLSYQAVIRDANNFLLSNASIGMQVSILEDSPGGTAVYVETQILTSVP